jgi:hypothetical protein
LFDCYEVLLRRDLIRFAAKFCCKTRFATTSFVLLQSSSCCDLAFLRQSPFRAVSIEHTAAPLPTKAGNRFVYAEKTP